MPNEFVPALEATGMILEAGRFVLEESCHQAAAWHRAGHPLGISVNASGYQLDRNDFVDVVQKALRSSHLPPDALTIELTETALMRNTNLSAIRLKALKAIGVKVAIDDFGTGYCSFSYLQQFPVDLLKIDQSFISQIEGSSEGEALIHTLVQLGKDLNIATVAEGIETRSQLERLRREGCEFGQGYLFARPLEASAFAKFVAARLPRLAQLEPTIVGHL